MPFDSQHVLLTWGGKLPGGESWSCGLRLCEQVHVPGANTLITQTETKSWLYGSLKSAVQAFHTAPTSWIAPACKLSFAKAARIGLDGKYIDQSTDEFVFPDLAGGGNAIFAIHPQQVALAVSLTTGYSRGLAHRGRFFMPMPVCPITETTGLIDTVTADQVRQSVKTFLEAVADVPGIDAPNSLTPSVMSRRGAGGHRVITGVEIGRALDTQRRRRRGLKENYEAVALDLSGD
jgi:hypothetical protein